MNTRPIVLVTGADLAPQAMQQLKAFEVVFAGASPSADELLALCRARNPVALIVRYGKVTADMMAAAPALRVISKHGSGIDNIDVAAAKAHRIEVRSAAGANAAAVAEHTIALLLACAKSTVHLHQRMCAGHWDKAVHKSVELQGLTLGLVGLGAIGQRVAKIADAMGMRVLGFDPFATSHPSFVKPVRLEHIWRESDAISLHCPLTPDNRDLVDTGAIAQMKSGVILVNTARGGLVDEVALLAAIRNGQVASAGLDSFAVEPLPADHPFRNEPGVTLSPHVGGVTADAYVHMGVTAANNVLAALATCEALQ